MQMYIHAYVTIILSSLALGGQDETWLENDDYFLIKLIFSAEGHPRMLLGQPVGVSQTRENYAFCDCYVNVQ